MYEVYCDESRQDLFYNKNAITDTNKYMFIGGIMIEQKDRVKIKNILNNIKQKYNLNIKSELKWNRITNSKLDMYKEVIDVFVNSNISFRTIKIDAKKVNLKKYHKDSAELGFYKFYYQLLNNWLNKYTDDRRFIVYTDIKTNKDLNVLKTLKQCLNNKSQNQLIEKIYAIESNESVFLQLEDILMGIASYKTNFENKGKSKSKLEMVDYLEKKLGHKIVNTTKSENKYNVFEIKL